MDYDAEEPIFDEEPHAKIDNERISIGVFAHQGTFRRAIPSMPMWLAAICCFCNVFVPGLGTFISAFSVLCFSDPRHGSKCQCVCTNIAAAFLQFITFPLVIGFVWSVIWGVLFMTISRKWYISSIDNRFSYVDWCPCSRC